MNIFLKMCDMMVFTGYLHVLQSVGLRNEASFQLISFAPLLYPYHKNRGKSGGSKFYISFKFNRYVFKA